MKFLNFVFINKNRKRRKAKIPKAINKSPTEKGIQPKRILKKEEM